MWLWRFNPDGETDVLGPWIEQTEGAKFWLKVINELKTRGVNGILAAVIDGLKGFPEWITSVFPQTTVQTCIVHLIREQPGIRVLEGPQGHPACNQGDLPGRECRYAIVRLEQFEVEWGKRYPAVGQAWRRAWEYVVPFFAFAPGIRKMIYTTNAVEAPHRSLRKIIKTRGTSPNDDAAISRSRMPACAGGEASTGRRPWVSSPFSSASDSQERRDDQDNRHHGTVDDRVVRTFAVKPSAFGAPLRGFRA